MNTAVTQQPLTPAQQAAARLTFGTYRAKGRRCYDVVRMALEHGICRVDTAQLYKNEDAVFEAIRHHEAANSHSAPVHVTTKIRKNLHFNGTIAAVQDSVNRLGRPLDVVLLHRPLPHVMWRALHACVEQGLVREIGVSNYSLERLQSLLSVCEPLGPCARPTVNQVELHPFVGSVFPLVHFCRDHGIRLQGHTVLTRGALLDFPRLGVLARELCVSPAVLLMKWVATLGADIVFHTRRLDHLEEVVGQVFADPALDPQVMAEISGFHGVTRQRFFQERPAPLPDAELDAIVDTDAYIARVTERLERDRIALASGGRVSTTAESLAAQSTREILADPICHAIADAMFTREPGKPAHSTHQKLRSLLSKLRARADAQREPKVSSCKLPPDHPALGPDWIPGEVKGRPVAASVAFPRAMPVEVAPGQELDPFFEFLRRPGARGEAALASPVAFVRGTYFPDQRMDLCKQVVGPTHVGRLCDAIAAQDHGSPLRVRHFLLGNNIACEGSGLEGATAMASLMQNAEIDIETWYLAGNAIGPKDMALMALALRENKHARALWLKRNPLFAEGARVIGELLGTNDTLELLDLHTTGLFDRGVEALVDGVLHTGGRLALKHLHVSGNALTERSVRSLRRLLTASLPDAASLQSLYISMNRLGDEGFVELASLIRTGALGGLVRLDVGANGAGGAGVAELVDAVLAHCPQMHTLDLGTYRAARDLGEVANDLSRSSGTLERLIREAPDLQLLDVANAGLDDASCARLVRTLGPRQSLHGIGRAAMQHTPEERRFLKSPPCVVNIDSVYRGRM